MQVCIIFVKDKERGKAIKRNNKILLLLLIVFVGLPLILSLVALLPGVQGRIVTGVTRQLSNKLNTEVSVGKVHYMPFFGVRLNDLLVRDHKSDTLVYAHHVHSGIDHFSIFKKHIYLGEVSLEEPLIHVSGDKEGMNFSPVLDSIAALMPDSAKWDFSLRGVRFQEGQLQLTHSEFKDSPLNKDTLLFSGLNLGVRRISALGDSLDVRLEQLEFSEKSGLRVESGQGNLRIRPDRFDIENFSLQTRNSRMELKQADYRNDSDAESSGPHFNAEVKRVYLSFEELALLLKDIPPLEKNFHFSGDISGSFNRLKGENILASLGEHTRMEASFDLTDLSDLHETFIFMDIKSLQTTANAFGDVLQNLQEDEASLPPMLSKLGTVRYSGNLTGFLNDLVAYGSFQTGLGRMNTDLSMRLESDNSLSFSGNLNTEGFRAGEFLGMDESMGKLTMNMDVSGKRRSATDYSAFLEGTIDSLEWNNYTYRDAEVNGEFSYQRFDGSIVLDDPYGNFRFDGEIDGSESLPRFHFRAHLENVMPDRLNIFPEMKDGVITMSVDTDLEGNSLDNLAGEMSVTDGLIFTPEASIEIDTMQLRAFEDEEKNVQLSSDFVDGRLSGQYNFSKFEDSFMDMVAHFLPSVAGRDPVDDLPLNRFDFDFDFKGFDDIAALFAPGLNVAADGSVKGSVDSENHFLNIDAAFDHFQYKGSRARGIEFHANANDGEELELVSRASEVSRQNLFTLYNFSVHHKASRDTLGMNLFWNNWGEITNSGAIYTETSFNRDKKDKFRFTSRVEPSSVILNDSVWNISEAKVMYTPELFSVSGLDVSHADQKLGLDGFLHRESMDGLRLEMDNIDLSQIFDADQTSEDVKTPLRFGGIADGSIELKDYYRSPLWSANFSVADFSFDGDTLGFFTVGSQWDREEEALAVTTSVKDGAETPLNGEGYINPQENEVDIGLDLDGFNISFLDTWVGNVIQDLDANTSGELFLSGPLDKPYLTGKVNVDSGEFDVDLLQTSYEVQDSVWFYPNEIRFGDLRVIDRYGEEGQFSGSIYHDGFADMIYNLQLDINDMLVLNTGPEDNPYYYGSVFARGNMHVSGASETVELNITGETLGDTRFFIPMADTEEAVQNNFIRFVSPQENSGSRFKEDEREESDYQLDMTGTEVNMEIDVTPQARVEIIFDSTIGDLLSAQGQGNIQIQIDRQGNINFFGDYEIEQGEYLFSLQNLVNKKFAINEGGTVSWQGEPYNAQIDLTAVYQLKASLSDLIGPMAETSTSASDDDMQRRIPIHCNLMLEGPLEQPGIKFGIEAPTLSESRESYMLDFISSEDEMNRQVLSLLVLNRFYTPDYLRMESDAGMQTNNAALVTTTEMLSNQLSRWLSTISSDVDVGVSYRPEDNISSEEIEVALSTQMFNNRVTINGNVGYGKYQTNTSKMVGDFDMDVMLNRSGTIRAKAYTHSNDDVIYETSPTTQGIGISFKEEFNSFKELLGKYWNAIFNNEQ
ncbi:MAG: translocation/assembly module TamB domain-containing protein [Bacteroidota bacterium]